MKKIKERIYLLVIYFLQLPRVVFFRLISPNTPSFDLSTKKQPVLFVGKGEIQLGSCTIGVWPSPGFLYGYAHIEAREAGSKIFIGDDVWINNGATLIADKSEIRIGSRTLIGTNFTVYDSDFHDLNPHRRFGGDVQVAPVNIGENVFIGSNVTVLKGVCIGMNSVVASGSVVSGNIPEDSIAAGVPAKVVGRVPN